MDGLRRTLVAVTTVGLAIDAYVHLALASEYDAVGGTITEGALFRFEAALAALAIVLLVVRPNRVTAAFAALVAGGGTLALLLYYLVNVGPIGPIPNMYEHVLFPEKSFTLVAQAIATVSALALVAIGGRRASNRMPDVVAGQSETVDPVNPKASSSKT